MTGIGLGIAARTDDPAGPRSLAPLVGYLLAVVLHAAWNLSSLSGLTGFFTGYVLIMVPAFATDGRHRRSGRAAGRARPWRPGSRRTSRRAGWTREDVPMLASLQRRRQALDWVEGGTAGSGPRALREFQHAATELAFLRDRLERGLDVPDFPARERELLREVSRTRAAAPSPPPDRPAKSAFGAGRLAGGSAVLGDQLVDPGVAGEPRVQVEQVVVGERRARPLPAPGARGAGSGDRLRWVTPPVTRSATAAASTLTVTVRVAGQAGEQDLATSRRCPRRPGRAGDARRATARRGTRGTTG